MKPIVTLALLVLTSTSSTLLRAQAPRWDAGVGLGASGPTRFGAEYAMLAGSHRVAEVGALTLSLDGAAMLKVGRGPQTACASFVLGNALCDSRELSHVGRVGASARFAPWSGLAPYLVGAVGVWGSTWENGERVSGATATPYGAVFDAGVGIPLPDTNRRTVIEARYGLFRQAEVGFGAPVRGGALRLGVHRRW